MKKGKALFEIVAALGFFFVFIVGLGVWRISTSPLDVDFAKPYIEHALSNAQRGTYARLNHIVLHWPNLGGPLLLNVTGAKVYGPDTNVIVAVDEVSLSLSKTGLLLGQIHPVALILKHPELTLIRDEDGKLDIGFEKADKKIQVEKQEDLTQRILSYIAHPGTEADPSPLATLKSFVIENARVNYENRQTNVTTYLPQVDVSFEGTNEGLDAKLLVHFDDKTQGLAPILRAGFLIPWKTKDVVVDAYLDNFSVKFLADKIPELSALDGQNMLIGARFFGVLDSNFTPQHLKFLGSSAAGAIQAPQLSDTAIPYKGLAVEVDYDKDKKSLVISNTGVTLNGVTLNISGALDAEMDKISGPVTLSIDELKQESIKALWPKILEGDATEEWLVKKMSEGTFYDVGATVNIVALKSGDASWEFNVPDALAKFTFDNMTVDYRNPLTPVTKAKGSGEFKLAEEKLSVTVDDGMIGDLKVERGDLEFVHIMEHGKGIADLHIKIDGPLKSGLEYLMLEPINLKNTLEVPKVKGNVKATVDVVFPAHPDLKVSDVKVAASGVLSDLTLPGVMKKLELTGGPLNFVVKDNMFKLNGEAKIEGQPAKIDYSEFLNSDGQAYKLKATATVTADNDMRKKMGIDLSDFLDGPAIVDAVYTEYTNGKADADLNVNLKPATVFYKPFNYEKKPGIDGTATLKAMLQDGALKQVTGLNAKAPNMEMKDAKFTFVGDSKLSSGDISNFVVGETVANLNFTVSEAKVYKIKLSGSFLDLRPFLENDDPTVPYTAPALVVDIAADRMRIAEGGTIQNAKLSVDIDAEGHFNTMELSGVAGKGDVSIAYAPDESGKRTFRMKAADAGATLAAFGVYPNMRGGTLDIYGEPIKGINDRNVKGLATIRDFKVVNAPILTRLLGLFSLPGILSTLQDDGLAFSKLEGKFNWRYRPSGSLLIVKDGRTSGNSVGFTFDGTYDQAKSKMDIDGTMIPLSGLNKFIGNIPLVGDILTGGTGGVFAATYSIKGDAKAPEVFVNPLSVLTPGILRRILFEQN